MLAAAVVLFAGGPQAAIRCWPIGAFRATGGFSQAFVIHCEAARCPLAAEWPRGA